jgi:hypothetical protein
LAWTAVSPTSVPAVMNSAMRIIAAVCSRCIRSVSTAVSVS